MTQLYGYKIPKELIKEVFKMKSRVYRGSVSVQLNTKVKKMWPRLQEEPPAGCVNCLLDLAPQGE